MRFRGPQAPGRQTWRTFLENHVKTMVSVDCFAVPTIRFQVLYVFLVLAHDRRRILHFGVTAHPWDSAPRFLLRDRDRGVMSSGVTAPTPLPRSHRGAVAALDPGAKPV
jgi:hypothetical protein